jgi:hypothetical protein
MLDPWIIDEILKREEEKRREQENRIELPLESPRRETGPQPAIPAPPEERDRGVTVIDI